MTTLASETNVDVRPVESRPATVSGLLLVLVTGSLAGSAFRALRIEIGDLLVHPYLPLATLLGLWLVPARFDRLPRGVLGAGTLFCVMYWVSSVPYPGGTSEVIKVISSCATIVVVALSIRSERDFELGATGLVFAAVVLSGYGLTGLGESRAVGINPLEDVANKNAFSLYVLPALLLAVHCALRPSLSRALRATHVVAAALIVMALLATANRSGWAGAALVGLMFVAERGSRFRALAIAGAVMLAAAGLVSTSESTSAVLAERVDRTTGGYESDSVRLDLVVASFEVAAANPVAGVGPQRLPYELARRVRIHAGRRVDPHNTLALLAGGCGFLTLAAFLLFGGLLWTTATPTAPGLGTSGPLTRMMLVLWAFRSLFTREILYSPAFSMGIGLCLGLVMLSKEQRPA